MLDVGVMWEACARVHPVPAAAAVAVNEDTDVTKMTLKQLRQVLAKRGVACEGCIEKGDFLKKVQETAHIKSQDL